eukprot:2407236-Ditylum_brightwellii.AAC.1
MEEGPGWKRAGEGKGQKRAKQEKITGLVTIDMSDHNIKQSVKKKMQERGERELWMTKQGSKLMYRLSGP